MGEESPLDKIPKLPISNYDIVVYFGVGISSLPFIYRYFLQGYNKKLPPVFNGYSDSLVNSAVSLIALAFALYIVGHGIALLSTIFIEQFLYRSFGTPSGLIVDSARPYTGGYVAYRDCLVTNFKKRYRSPASIDIFRVIFHVPVIPLYLIMFMLRLHGFYETKLSPFIVLRVQSRLEKRFAFDNSIFNSIRWFKIVEYACANDHPIATAKMYNYMVIFGLFRSISFLLLIAIWMELYLYLSLDGLGFLDINGHGHLAARLAVLYGAYLVSFVGFGKFSRRYTEEALQAFALSKVFDE